MLWSVLFLLSAIHISVPETPSSWRVGIHAIDLESGETLVSVNADAPFRPASTVKAVTTLSALITLGSSYIYRTTIEIDTLGHRILLRGSGAPLLSIEDVARAAMETAAILPEAPCWSLFLDPSAMTGDSHLPGWDEDDWNRTYCPPVEPLCIGDNVLEVVISSVNGRVRLFSYPPLPGLRIFRESLTTGSTTALTAVGGNWETAEPEIRISGTIRSGDRKILYQPFAGAPGELAMVLQEELSSLGVNSENRGILNRTDQDAAFSTASVMYSDPLWIILGSMNKWSRNMVAEQILRTVARETSGEPGSTRAGCDVSGALLDSLVPGAEGWQLADGSGLSRLNLLTPRQMAAVFRAGATSLEFGPEFLASFPVNGVDGTLSSRMESLPEGSFRGKTGSLNDTCTITGILTTRNGRKVALAIFLEIPSGQILRARAWQDSYIEALYTEL